MTLLPSMPELREIWKKDSLNSTSQLFFLQDIGLNKVLSKRGIKVSKDEISLSYEAIQKMKATVLVGKFNKVNKYKAIIKDGIFSITAIFKSNSNFLPDAEYIATANDVVIF